MAIRSRTREENKIKLETGLKNLSDYLTSNEMVLNCGKTQVSESMVHQKRSRMRGEPPSLLTVDSKGNQKLVKDSSSCRILGIQISNDLGWRDHLEGKEKPLLPALRQKLGQLKFLGKVLPQKGKLLLINSLLMSKIIYTISVYGGIPAESGKENTGHHEQCCAIHHRMQEKNEHTCSDD